MFVEAKEYQKQKAHKKLILGVGINDADYRVFYKVGKIRILCPYYDRWRGMLYRCYSPKTQARQPTYQGCSICDEWLTFSNFKKWMQMQDWEGKHLDKDIIQPDNKVYSPETCAFVDRATNNLLLDAGKARGPYPQGVTLERKTGRYMARCPSNGIRKTIGRFKSINEAEKAYKEFKYNEIIRIADLQSDQRVKEGLYKHAESLNKTPELL